MKRRTLKSVVVMLGMVSWLTASGWAQVNSGSNGSDGQLNVTNSTTINMADHPNGIYQYTSVNIANGATVTFIPNANNTPVVWLVQSNVIINGSVDVSGQYQSSGSGGLGGPGGYRGGNGGATGSSGQGPGGGYASAVGGGNASFGTLGYTTACFPPPPGVTPPTYGNNFLVPLLGGSGGGGATNYYPGGSGVGGGGGAGAILVAASGTIQLVGSILAKGGTGWFDGYNFYATGGGSGGSVRLIASAIAGNGSVNATGGMGGFPCSSGNAGQGRVRLDTYANSFGGTINGTFTQGYQPIIIPTPGQGAQLTVTSVGGVPVSASPTGQVFTPDAVISSQQANPIPIVVQCSNIALNTLITVIVTPVTGSSVSASGYNTTGTQASSMATILVNMPRAGGIIYATAATAP